MYNREKDREGVRRMRGRILALLLILALAVGAAARAEVDLPDGEYAPDGIAFSGGSGRVTISCTKLRIVGGKALVTLVFSSPNYTKLVADGVEYAATHDGDTSVFEVPAPLSADFTVVATTTAMSAPHDIEYTLHIYLGEDAPQAEPDATPADAGEVVDLGARARDIPGLAWQRELPLRYARQFAVDYYDGGCKLLTLADGARYLVVPEGGAIPDGLDGDVRVLRQPLDRVYLAATAAMALFDALNALDAVRFSGTRADGWTVESAADAMRRGDMIYAGKYSEPDYELLLDGGCDLALESTMILHAPKVREMLEALGVPVLVERSSYEAHPLGRTEWVKLYGALLDREEEAEAFFDAQAAAVDALEDFPDAEKTVAFFYVATDGGVVVRGPDDYVAGMIELAGGRYAFDAALAGQGTRASVSVSMEDFYAVAVDADCLIYNGSIDAPLESVTDLLKKSPLFADFRAVKSGDVFTTDRSLYQATDALGDFIVDLNRMLRGETEGMRFLKRVESEE